MRYVDGRQEPAVRARVVRYANNQGVDVMRNLTVDELAWVAGGDTEITVSASVGAASVGVTVKTDKEASDMGQVLIDLYESAVEATSHVIERVMGIFE